MLSTTVKLVKWNVSLCLFIFWCIYDTFLIQHELLNADMETEILSTLHENITCDTLHEIH